MRLACQVQSFLLHSFRKLCSLKEHDGRSAESYLKKLSGDEFRENGMSLESPIKKRGIIFEAGKKWGKRACSVETVL